LAKPPDLADRLARSFSALFRGFYWLGSESDDVAAFHAFSAPFDASEKLSVEAFRRAAGIGPSWTIDIRTADRWFAEMSESFRQDEYSGEEDRDLAAAYEHLQRAMKATLEGQLQLASVHASGEAFHKARYYVFGRVARGGLAGLMAYSVET
jgi:hypothetical protein